MAVRRCLLPGKAVCAAFALVVALSIALGTAAPAAAQQGPGDFPVFIPLVVRMGQPATPPPPPPPGGVPAARLATNQLAYCAVTNAGTVQCWGHPGIWSGKIFPSESNVPVTIPNLSGVKAVGVGDGFACALTAAGGVKCWGNNVSGQLGNGTMSDSAAPVDVTGLPSGVKQIAVGDLFACALTDGGAVKCWGNNKRGQAGVGNWTNQLVPAQVLGKTSGVTAITAGEAHACALAAGGVSCWGSDEFGQMGSANIQYYEFNTPQVVADLGAGSGVTAISADNSHTCAILTGGSMKCFGLNNGGEMGTGDRLPVMTPKSVLGLPGSVTGVSTGQHTCAILTDGRLSCWGWNMEGELGSGEKTTDELAPNLVSGISGVAEVATGMESTCVLLTSGKLTCWGSNTGSQLGAGDIGSGSLVPVPVVGW